MRNRGGQQVAPHVLFAMTNEDDVSEANLETMSVVGGPSLKEGPDKMAWIGEGALRNLVSPSLSLVKME
jgi:hypothetical protein